MCKPILSFPILISHLHVVHLRFCCINPSASSQKEISLVRKWGYYLEASHVHALCQVDNLWYLVVVGAKHTCFSFRCNMRTLTCLCICIQLSLSLTPFSFLPFLNGEHWLYSDFTYWFHIQVTCWIHMLFLFFHVLICVHVFSCK
jgi:hypothetical protein